MVLVCSSIQSVMLFKMSSHTSPRVKDYQPESDEIVKAAVLSSLACLDNEQAMAAVQTQYSDIGFERILMTQHFTVGFDINKTRLYVAFGKRLSIQNMFAVKVADRSEFVDVEGLFHYELFEIITSKLPSMSHFQHQKANRIIFSGHGSAGALAHLFLICYMIKTQEEDREHISIGFGSPYFCDDAARRFCQKTMELNWRMFTFVNDADPVPWMLEDIRMTCNPQSIERTGTQSRSPCLERLNIWLNSANSDERREIMDSTELDSVQSILKEMRSIRPLNMPRYVSVGVYCDGRGSTIRGGSMNLLDKIKESVSITKDKVISFILQQGFPDVFGNQAFQEDSWQCHRIESYVNKFASNEKRVKSPSKPVMEVAPNPCIHACTLSVYNGEPSYEGVITIRGSDLSDDCPEKPIVEPNIGHEWMVEHASESIVLLKGILTKFETETRYIWKKDEMVEQPNLSVKLRTCFGSTHKDFDVEDSWKDGDVASALARGIGRLFVMQQSEGLRSSAMYREAFGTLKKEFPGLLDNLSHFMPETKKNVFDIMKSSLTRPVEIPFLNPTIAEENGQTFIASSTGVRIKCGLYLSTSLSSDPELSSMIPDYACISKFCHGSYFSIFHGGIRILNYRDIVRTIYCLLSGTKLKDDQSDVYYYEKEIHNQVREGQAVKRRQSLPKELQADIDERSRKMSGIITACNSMERLKFATFIGPENAGKTTLINSVLGENVGDVGFTTHTTTATPYKFKDDIFLVDFPGTAGGGDRAHLSKIWEEYDNVADLCVVVLNFGGDTSRAAQVFPRIARSQTWRGDIVLVINRVDSVMNGSRNSPVWGEYSPEKVKQLKISMAKNSGLSAERVFFSVSRASEDLEETTRQLLRERFIMLKDEITELL